MRTSFVALAVLLAPVLARHSLNHGPTIATRQSSEPIIPILTSAVRSDDPRAHGKAIAEAFVAQLHPELAFRFSSGALSEHNGVYVAHFLQRHNQRDVVTGTINVNIDVATGVVLSYGDAAFTATAAAASALDESRCRALADKLDRLEDGARKQIVLGAPAVTASAAARTELDACLAGLARERPVDPRVALAAFLIPVRNAQGIHAVAPDSDLDALVASMHIEHSLRPASGASAESQLRIHNAPGALEPVEARLAYIEHEQALKLIWSFRYQSLDNWYEASVAASHDARLETLAVTDWVRDFAPSEGPTRPSPPHKEPSKPKKPPHQPKQRDPDAVPEYRVFEWGTNDPSEGKRHVVVDPSDDIASPFGWHTIPTDKKWQGRTRGEDWMDEIGWSSKLGGGMNSTDTRGNNVFAQENWSGGVAFELNHRPSAHDLNFSYPLHWGPKENRTGRDIDPKSYIDVAVTELFYTCNEMHDLFYRYGFDEEHANFQHVNPSGRGLGGDPVVAMAQDGSGMDNANFATPPDGQRPRMRMYVWDGPKPFRDGDLEAGIVIHEYSHGISTRLTGSPSDSSCLGWGEAGGMGEGWGDFFATLIRMHGKNPHDWTMGEWAAARGIRNYPYSLNMTVNPSTYKILDKPGYWGVHAIGEVWAEYLFVMAETLIGKHGWHSTLFPPVPTSNTTETELAEQAFYNTSSKTGKRYPAHGNTLAMQLVVDGMKLQPCRPSFSDARDAILLADKVLTGGDNARSIWTAFAGRGLGPGARLIGSTPWGGGTRREDYSLPSSLPPLPPSDGGKKRKKKPDH